MWIRLVARARARFKGCGFTNGGVVLLMGVWFKLQCVIM